MSSVLGVVEALSDEEGIKLLSCEAVIDTDCNGFTDVGLAFAQIRDGRLYRGEFEGFEAYCQAKWQYGRRYVNQIISAAQLFTHLGANCSLKPQHESQLRPLLALTVEQGQQAWDHAVKNAGGRRITARLVKNAVKELQLGGTLAPVPEKPRVNKAEQRRLIDDAIGQLLALLSQGASHDTLTAKVEELYGHIQPLLATKPNR